MTNFMKLLIVIIVIYHYVVLDAMAYSVTINTPRGLIYENSNLTITWTLVGTQTSKATLSILEILTRRETIIDHFVDLPKGKEIWKINVPAADYELIMEDDQSMMLPVSSDIFTIYPAKTNETPISTSSPVDNTNGGGTTSTPTKPNTGSSNGTTDSSDPPNKISQDSIVAIVVSIVGAFAVIVSAIIAARCVKKGKDSKNKNLPI